MIRVFNELIFDGVASQCRSLAIKLEVRRQALVGDDTQLVFAFFRDAETQIAIYAELILIVARVVCSRVACCAFLAGRLGRGLQTDIKKRVDRQHKILVGSNDGCWKARLFGTEHV